MVVKHQNRHRFHTTPKCSYTELWIFPADLCSIQLQSTWERIVDPIGRGTTNYRDNDLSSASTTKRSHLPLIRIGKKLFRITRYVSATTTSNN
ncbi:hypothetical protein Y695_00457 [Hydrogenophaga sp. T4]|nr:hypothetical protein Y695_00457 [Hydrogenophaga sp. T4]